ncbi:MAG: diadenylate cyclase CdaA [Candidatus Cloacimonetes bacterium]|nr:diadenylate cyclase CdaA [Candidatus Cloacimonadota bacterium]
MEFLIPSLASIVDILVVWVILYRVYLLFKRTGGYQILLGLVVILLLSLVAAGLKLEMLSRFLSMLRQYWVIVLIVLFQPEIRATLARIAHDHNFRDLFHQRKKVEFAPLLNAISIMSFRKIGGLFVIENKRRLNNYLESGEMVDALISVKLLLTVFNNKSILHDGAAVIRGERLLAVKVVLPLSEKLQYTRKFGTRHLAAIGITEITDAIAVVVSEETGEISFVKQGNLTGDITIDELSQLLKDEIE